MRYIPNTDIDCQKMLREIGVDRVEELWTDIPQDIRLREPLRLPPAMSEPELVAWMNRISRQGGNLEEYVSFLGAGAYRHYIPSVVRHLIGRSEFYTTYTPYQPEISQGTLQAAYEFQTLICQLTGMEVANTSMYDGASAAAEAALMAHRLTKRSRLLLSRAIHPEYRQVIRTYAHPLGIQIQEIPFAPEGATRLEDMEKELTGEDAALILQSPNFFGCIENLTGYADVAHRKGALFIVVVPEPISLGLLKPPGELNADIVVGEGQGLGNPLNFGGPYLGFFATRERYLRYLPGRLVGETVDRQGHRGYVLTLATREQHIRRDRATSNICTNQALCALAASIYLSTLGRRGLNELASLNLRKAYYAKDLLTRLDSISLKFSAPTFNEFVLSVSHEPRRILHHLLDRKIVGGLDLSNVYPELGPSLLWCVTEVQTKEEIDRLFEALQEIEFG